MPPYVNDTIIWVCVGAFVICLIAALLAMFGIWTPKDEAVKKWLYTGLLFSVVGGVGSYAAKAFTGGNDPATHVTEAIATPTPLASASPSPVATPKPTPTPVVSATVPTPAIPDIPEALTAWAEAALGPRPTLAAFDLHPYPTCVQDLRQMAADDVPDEEADACVSAIDRYQTLYVAGYYQVKLRYVARLSTQERALRPRSDAESRARYDFVLAEKARLNGAEWDRLQGIDDQLRDDRISCKRHKCAVAT